MKHKSQQPHIKAEQLRMTCFKNQRAVPVPFAAETDQRGKLRDPAVTRTVDGIIQFVFYIL